MIRKLLKPLTTIALMAALAPAYAQMRHRQMENPNPRMDFERGAMQQQRAEPYREMPQRQEFGPHGRMSPEERRQLRRDIHDAGRELYRESPPRSP